MNGSLKLSHENNLDLPSDAIEIPISWQEFSNIWELEELIGVATSEKDGLMPSIQRMTTSYQKDQQKYCKIAEFRNRLTGISMLISVLEGLLPLATNETKGLASMNMCIAYVGEGPVICIKPTKLKQYYYTLLTVTVYENGYFKKIDLAVYYPVKKGGHKCSMSGNGNMFVKEDSDYNLYIHNKTLNNINYCVSIIGASKYINIPSITVEAHPASVLNGLTLTDVATM